MAHHEEDLSEEEQGMLKKMLAGIALMPLMGFGSLLLKLVKTDKKKKRGRDTDPAPPPAPRP